MPQLDPSDTRPIHQQIATALRAAIEDGRYPAGERIPGENVLIQGYGVSQWTAREALAALNASGHITKVPKVGTFVRDQRRLTRKPRRYARQKPEGEFATEARAAGFDPDIEAVTHIVPASEQVARRLEVAAGVRVAQTDYRFLADGRAIQLSTSWEPHSLTAGTPIAVPEAGPLAGTGVITRFDSIGIRVTRVVEEVAVRPPREHETNQLAIPAGVHVFVIGRTFYAEDQPIETADIVIPGDRYSLVYAFNVPQPSDDPEMLD